MASPNVVPEKMLGKGAFGEAMLVRDVRSGEKLVQKKIKCNNMREVQASAKSP
jgi:hypothetical protein